MSFAQTLMWLSLAAAGAIVLAELFARAWLKMRGEYYVWAPYARMRMELDRETLPALERVVHFEINRDGERGDPIEGDQSRTYRVLVAGGSVAECYFLDQKSSWPYVIQEILNRPDSLAKLGVAHAHVGNISRSLVACRHILVMLERVLPRYERLDAIVFMVGASDVVHWLEKGAPATLADEKIEASQIFARHPEGPFGWTPKTLGLRRIASHWNKRLRRPVDVRSRAGRSLGQARQMRARAPTVLDRTPDPAPMLDHFENDLRAMIRVARTKAKRVIVVRQPWFDKAFTPDEEKWMWNFGAGRPYAEEVTTYYSHRVVWDLMQQVDARAAAVARELDAEAIDLMPILDRSLATYYDELHHTPAGCRAVATVVAQTLLDGVASKVAARG